MTLKSITFAPGLAISTQRLLKWIGVFGMVSFIGVKFAGNLLAGTTPGTPHQFMNDIGTLFALISVLYLVFSITKPAIRHASHKAQTLSAQTIGNIYFTVGCCSFALFLMV